MTCPICNSTQISSNIRYNKDETKVIGGHRCLDCTWTSEEYHDKDINES